MAGCVRVAVLPELSPPVTLLEGGVPMFFVKALEGFSSKFFGPLFLGRGRWLAVRVRQLTARNGQAVFGVGAS